MGYTIKSMLLCFVIIGYMKCYLFRKFPIKLTPTSEPLYPLHSRFKWIGAVDRSNVR